MDKFVNLLFFDNFSIEWSWSILKMSIIINQYLVIFPIRGEGQPQIYVSYTLTFSTRGEGQPQIYMSYT
jgi:hypothetical protein